MTITPVAGRTYLLVSPVAYSSFAPGTALTLHRPAGEDRSVMIGKTRDGYDHSEYVDHDRLTVPAPSSPAEVTDLASFQALLVDRSYSRQRRHGLCGEVQKFLTDDLGLERILPHQEVKITLTLSVPVGQTAYYGAETATERVRQAIEGTGLNVMSAIHDTAYEDVISDDIDGEDDEGCTEPGCCGNPDDDDY